MNRRIFLMTSTAAGTRLGASRRSPNDTVRVACVGFRGRGQIHLRSYTALPKVDVAAVCDVDQSLLDAAVRTVASKRERPPAAYTDLRKLLEDDSIDAVSLATPNHQHTLQTLWACQAGKDVFVEKPCSHDMFEARQIVAAARRYDRIVQQGSQARSSAALREAIAQIRAGLIGDVYMARAVSFKARQSIGHAPVEPVPSGVDYDLWLGPAPKRPFTRNRFHYNWHWFWDYGNGDIGNQGIHEIDIARWGLDVKYPTKVSAIGGHFMYDDDQETPNTISCLFEFEGGGKKKMMSAEVRHWISNHEADIHEFTGYADQTITGSTVGNIFYGSKGFLTIDGYTKYSTFLGKEHEPGPAARQGGDHFLNFINAVRSRRREDLTAEIEEGAISSVLVHLANISYRTGRTIRFDADSYSCVGDAETNRMFRREYRSPFIVPEVI